MRWHTQIPITVNMWQSLIKYASKRFLPALLGYEISEVLENSDKDLVRYVPAVPTEIKQVESENNSEMFVIAALLFMILVAFFAGLFKLYCPRRANTSEPIELRDL